MDSKKARTSRCDIPLSPSLASELGDQVQCKAAEGYVFCRGDGRPLTASWVAENVWGPTLDRLGLERRRVYQES